MPIVRLPKGSLRDEIRIPLYDTITQAAAESPVGIRNFFSSVQGKSRARTNLRQNNLLETAVSYRVQGLALDAQSFYAANIRVLPIVMENSSLRLRIGEKDYWEGTMVFAAGRLNSELTRSSGTGEAAGTVLMYQRFGDQAVQPVVLTGKHVVDINPLQSFNAEWTVSSADLTAGEITDATPAASTNIKYTFSLKGLQRRPVQ
jgi:hypothetical protein